MFSLIDQGDEVQPQASAGLQQMVYIPSIAVEQVHPPSPQVVVDQVQVSAPAVVLEQVQAPGPQVVLEQVQASAPAVVVEQVHTPGPQVVVDQVQVSAPAVVVDQVQVSTPAVVVEQVRAPALSSLPVDRWDYIPLEMEDKHQDSTQSSGKDIKTCFRNFQFE